jgi:hypothetical protein
MRGRHERWSPPGISGRPAEASAHAGAAAQAGNEGAKMIEGFFFIPPPVSEKQITCQLNLSEKQVILLYI